MNTTNFQLSEGLEFLKTVPDESIRLVLTDPPYLVANLSSFGEAYKHFDTEETFTMKMLEQFVKEWFRVLKPGGTLICWFDVFKMETLRGQVERAGFGKRIRLIDWQKDGGNQVEVKTTYLGWTEWALVASKGPTKDIVFNNKDPETGKAIKQLGHFPGKAVRGNERFHPTQKPLDVFRQLVKLHTNHGDIVLDSFAGSATTGEAALLEGRLFWGSEMNPEYFNKACLRLNHKMAERHDGAKDAVK